MKIQKNKGFTLVELIVVITILAILGTIAFISLQGYSKKARNSKRISDINNINLGLELFNTKFGKYPIPDNYVKMSASGTLFGYQGFAGKNLLSKINVSQKGKDPLNNEYYTYMTSSNLSKFQIIGFLENLNLNKNIANNNKIPFIKGHELGIIFSYENFEPIQKIGNLDLINNPNNYLIYFNNNKNINGTGAELFTKYYNNSETLLARKDLAKYNKSLIGYWDMETIYNTGGIDYLKDLSGNKNHGTSSGLTIGNKKGKNGYSTMFGKPYSGINLGKIIGWGNTEDKPFTISVLAKLNGKKGTLLSRYCGDPITGDNCGLSGPPITGYFSFDLSYYPGDIFSGDNRFLNSISLSLNKRQQAQNVSTKPNSLSNNNGYKLITVTYNGNNSKLYYDGILVSDKYYNSDGSNFSDRNFSGTIEGQPDIWIGNYRPETLSIRGQDNVFKSVIDDVRFYNKVLNEDEIRLLYYTLK